MTTVVNLRVLSPGWEKNPEVVYIGRRGRGQDGYFGNPFPLRPGQSRGATIEKYKRYFYDRLERDPEFKARVQGLRGKKLACFCAPSACHGNVIAEYLDGNRD